MSLSSTNFTWSILEYFVSYKIQNTISRLRITDIWWIVLYIDTQRSQNLAEVQSGFLQVSAMESILAIVKGPNSLTICNARCLRCLQESWQWFWIRFSLCSNSADCMSGFVMVKISQVIQALILEQPDETSISFIHSFYFIG